MYVLDNLITARVQMQKRFPFFAYLVMYLKLIEDAKVPTMGVNAYGELFYNSEWTKKLSKEQVMGVLTHEVMHCALLHIERTSKRDPYLCNVAMDLVVNDLLITNKLELPEGTLIPKDHSFTFPVGKKSFTIKDIDKKIWEEIYDELLKNIDKQTYQFDVHIMGKGDGKKDKAEGKGSGDKKDSNGPSKDSISEKQKISPDWAKAISEAYTYSQIQGNAPAGLDRLIEKLHFPTISWKQILEKFIQREIPYDFSYSRPSKKSISAGVFLPTVIRENLEIVIGIDSSGSISQQMLEDFLSEVLGILQNYTQIDITALVCDAEIHSIQTLNSLADIKNIKLLGGGGTDFRPVFKWVRENKPMSQLILYLTDLYGDFPEVPPSTPTIWCCPPESKQEKIPFGVKVVMKDEKIYKEA